ncbi:hypothetical protein STEG23_035416 [Scotinomys teguina]
MLLIKMAASDKKASSVLNFLAFALIDKQDPDMKPDDFQDTVFKAEVFHTTLDTLCPPRMNENMTWNYLTYILRVEILAYNSSGSSLLYQRIYQYPEPQRSCMLPEPQQRHPTGSEDSMATRNTGQLGQKTREEVKTIQQRQTQKSAPKPIITQTQVPRCQCKNTINNSQGNMAPQSPVILRQQALNSPTQLNYKKMTLKPTL